jgi:histone acetyltransferase
MGTRILTIDLRTLEDHVETDKYKSIDTFYKDASLIFANCRQYNQEGSSYVRR